MTNSHLLPQYQNPKPKQGTKETRLNVAVDNTGVLDASSTKKKPKEIGQLVGTNREKEAKEEVVFFFFFGDLKISPAGPPKEKIKEGSMAR